jgi:hypothetical protein
MTWGTIKVGDRECIGTVERNGGKASGSEEGKYTRYSGQIHDNVLVV